MVRRSDHFPCRNVLVEHFLLLLSRQVFFDGAAARPLEVVERGIVSILVITRTAHSASCHFGRQRHRQFDAISPHSDESLEERLADLSGVSEDNDVAMFRRLIGQ
jgi:hypothetical protein